MALTLRPVVSQSMGLDGDRSGGRDLWANRARL